MFGFDLTLLAAIDPELWVLAIGVAFGLTLAGGAWWLCR